MPQTVRAAVMVEVGKTEIQEFALPQATSDTGVLRVEACGVCGADPLIYKRTNVAPSILGHEVIGTISDIGDAAASRWGVAVGDRVALEEYIPCWHCEWCLKGEFRLCATADRLAKGSIRLGQASTQLESGLWGGYAQYIFLHPNSVMHKIPKDLPAKLAAIALPLGNGIQWACIDGGAGAGKTVLVIGPGQQGICCAMAAAKTGSSQVILAGMNRDANRLRVGKLLGADVIVDVEKEDLAARVMELTGGRGADVIVDATSDISGRVATTALAVAAKGATCVLQGRGPGIPLDQVGRKALTIKASRGHSYGAVELALEWLASGKHPFEEMSSHSFGLSQVDTAIRATAGQGITDAIHVTVTPWA